MLQHSSLLITSFARLMTRTRVINTGCMQIVIISMRANEEELSYECVRNIYDFNILRLDEL